MRAENAVIMAAGMSSRFVPISYEMPKGLLTVRGEVLIERQIRQLLAAGIRDIVVVVGYQKEKFRYLAEKYGAELVENKNYERYNNTSTLMCVLDRLSNTYICSSDNYFVQNVFDEEVTRTYYAAVYQKGKTNEWCMNCDCDGRIRSVSIGGADAWCMMGHAYFSKGFSNKFRQILQREYQNAQTKAELWEAVCIRHLEELEMYGKMYEAKSILEFDSLEELRQFDKQYVNETGSMIMQEIAERLRCREGDIRDIMPMKDAKRGFRFSVHENSYKYICETKRIERV